MSAMSVTAERWNWRSPTVRSLYAPKMSDGPSSGKFGDADKQARRTSCDPSGEQDSGPQRILLIEDDAAMQRMIVNYLGDHGMRVVPAFQRSDAARRIADGKVDLLLLDLVLGKEDGLDLLRDVRLRSDVPVIIITGHRRDEADRVVGLELGADDYITKPFSVRELLARIKAVLRRRAAARIAVARQAERGRYAFGGWQVDRETRRLHSPAGAAITLTKGEYALLVAFLDAPQRTLTREYLLQATRVHEDVFDRSIDVQILRLRRKLETDPSRPCIICTERGVGYVFALPVERLS
jgi:two-component system, OmpR family, response regulator